MCISLSGIRVDTSPRSRILPAVSRSRSPRNATKSVCALSETTASAFAEGLFQSCVLWEPLNRTTSRNVCVDLRCSHSDVGRRQVETDERAVAVALSGFCTLFSRDSAAQKAGFPMEMWGRPQRIPRLLVVSPSFVCLNLVQLGSSCLRSPRLVSTLPSADSVSMAMPRTIGSRRARSPRRVQSPCRTQTDSRAKSRSATPRRRASHSDVVAIAQTLWLSLLARPLGLSLLPGRCRRQAP